MNFENKIKLLILTALTATLSPVIAAFGITIASLSTAHATVDMKNANYTESWIDIQISTGGYDLRVQRTYNSRSIFNGIFGFGWCSDFETKITKNPEGFLKLQECGAGQEITYKPRNQSGDPLETTVNAILSYYKKTTPNAGASSVETLKEQLINNSDLRNRWARAAKISSPNLVKGTVFVSENMQIEQIVYDGTIYSRSLVDGTSQKFDNNGNLISIIDKNGNFLKLRYSSGLLREIVDNAGKKLSLAYYPTKRVKGISAPGGINVSYTYKGEDLIEAKNQWTNTYIYTYDDNHNITKIGYPDNTFKALTYNQKNDWVTSFTDRSLNGAPGCREAYEYFSDKLNPKDHFWSTVVKTCGKEVKNEARFEFWLKSLPNGKKFLARVLNRTTTGTLDITYHPEIGRPTSIKQGSVTTSFDYYKNGLVREKSTAASKLIFEYKNHFNKVSKVNADYFNNKGKLIKKRETLFNYDGKGNLASAQNTDGQSVRLTYDSRGRIATIIDQAKKEVRINYEERTGRPSRITRPKVGTIAVTYKPNGDISKIDSNDGPAVATQVASTFNNLLDIIAPATSEMNM